jgi:hypothetical protein
VIPAWRLWLAGAAVAATLVTVGWVYLSGRSAGRATVEADQFRRAVEHTEVRREVETEMRAGAGERPASERLRDGWSRSD